MINLKEFNEYFLAFNLKREIAKCTKPLNVLKFYVQSGNPFSLVECNVILQIVHKKCRFMMCQEMRVNIQWSTTADMQINGSWNDHTWQISSQANVIFIYDEYFQFQTRKYLHGVHGTAYIQVPICNLEIDINNFVSQSVYYLILQPSCCSKLIILGVIS